MTKTCSNCSVLIDADSVFCKSCGVRIVQTIECPQCGERITADAKSCKYCAFNLSPPIHPVATAQTAEPQNITPVIIDYSAKPSDGQVIKEVARLSRGLGFIAPAACFALISFFLPWVEFDEGFMRRVLNGVELAEHNRVLYLVPLAALVCLGAFLTKAKRNAQKSKSVIIFSSLVAMAVLIYQYVELIRNTGGRGSRHVIVVEQVTLQYGSYATFLAFLAVLLGALFLTSPLTTDLQKELPSNYGLTESRNARIAAALCYAFYFLIPLSVFLPIVFLNKQSFKRSFLVRYHAFQALFFIGLSVCISVCLLLLLFVASTRRNFAYSEFFALTIMSIAVMFVASSVLLAYKAYKNQFFELPIIGGWAARLANKK